MAFCVPPNETLLGYWDLVEDRLFKIRHCMNIEGIARTLPLWEPRIDPALLVRAKAAGLEIDGRTGAHQRTAAATPLRHPTRHRPPVYCDGAADQAASF